MYFTYYPSVQWAAVRTQSELISVPPQNCRLKMFEPVPEVKATCQGASLHPAFVPPTIFVKFPFLIKSSLLREPEQGTQVPLWALPPPAPPPPPPPKHALTVQIWNVKIFKELSSLSYFAILPQVWKPILLFLSWLKVFTEFLLMCQLFRLD